MGHGGLCLLLLTRLSLSIFGVWQGCQVFPGETAQRVSRVSHSCTASHCNTLQNTAIHCNTLQEHTARIHCNTLQHSLCESRESVGKKSQGMMCGVARLLSAGAAPRERLLSWQEQRKCLRSLVSGPDPLGALARTRDSPDALHALPTLSSPTLSSLGTPEAFRYCHSVGETAEKECFFYCQMASCGPSLCR